MSDTRELSESNGSVVVECHLDEPPAKVWRALTEPHLLAAWLMPNDIHPEVGHRFSLLSHDVDSPIDCEILEVEPEHRLSFTWHSTERTETGESYTLASVVTFILTETFRGGTFLRLVHRGSAPVNQWLGHRISGAAPESHCASRATWACAA